MKMTWPLLRMQLLQKVDETDNENAAECKRDDGSQAQWSVSVVNVAHLHQEATQSNELDDHELMSEDLRNSIRLGQRFWPRRRMANSAPPADESQQGGWKQSVPACGRSVSPARGTP